MTSHGNDFRGLVRSRPRAYATCSIYGDDLEPDYWTSYFGVEPNISVVRGQLFKTPSGRLSRKSGWTGVWGYSSKLAVCDDTLNPHVQYLISRLNLPRVDLPTLLHEKKAKLRLLCFWENYSGNRVPTIGLELKHIIEQSGGIIEVDEYPQLHKRLDESGVERDFWV